MSHPKELKNATDKLNKKLEKLPEALRGIFLRVANEEDKEKLEAYTKEFEEGLKALKTHKSTSTNPNGPK